MRPIKFRGKRIDIGEWVYGYYLVEDGDVLIATDNGDEDGHILEFAKVIPETVGQYTGLKDKNGLEIYDGDIVSFTTFDCFDHDTQWTGVIKFANGQWEIWDSDKSPYYDSDGAFSLYWVCGQDEEIEIIGNIHTNPELLEADQ
jgi:uncharacterized phage protein (TIGR01671 family)